MKNSTDVFAPTQWRGRLIFLISPFACNPFCHPIFSRGLIGSSEQCGSWYRMGATGGRVNQEKYPPPLFHPWKHLLDRTPFVPRTSLLFTQMKELNKNRFWYLATKCMNRLWCKALHIWDDCLAAVSYTRDGPFTHTSHQMCTSPYCYNPLIQITICGQEQSWVVETVTGQ